MAIHQQLVKVQIYQVMAIHQLQHLVTVQICQVIAIHLWLATVLICQVIALHQQLEKVKIFQVIAIHQQLVAKVKVKYGFRKLTVLSVKQQTKELMTLQLCQVMVKH